jgi:hypothetical protein
VTVLLAADAVELYPPDPAADDAHGWVAQPGAAPSWSGMGSLQLGPGTSDPRAADRGGAGPFAPAAVEIGSLFLPVDAAPAEGTVAVVRGRPFALANVRLVVDPTGGGIDCYVAAASGLSRWPPEGTTADG